VSREKTLVGVGFLSGSVKMSFSTRKTRYCEVALPFGGLFYLIPKGCEDETQQ